MWITVVLECVTTSYTPYPGYSNRQLAEKWEMYHMPEGDYSNEECARACDRNRECVGYEPTPGSSGRSRVSVGGGAPTS